MGDRDPPFVGTNPHFNVGETIFALIRGFLFSFTCVLGVDQTDVNPYPQLPSPPCSFSMVSGNRLAWT